MKLPNNVENAIRDYVDSENMDYMATSIDIPIIPKQKTVFEGMWTGINGDVSVQFEIYVVPNECRVSSIDEDGVEHVFEPIKR